jgi:cation diffusion facilitator CzcD-associated flavoprotein CzcO
MDVHVAIIGAGFSGIGAAIRLQQQGITDVVLLERANALGGTWRDNDYPGCACDVPSRLYSFSFAQHSGWTRRFSAQPEILAYLTRVAAEYGITPRIRLGHALQSARWDDAAQRWRIVTTGGSYAARVLLLATGALSDASVPTIEGLDTFDGPVFHSSQWQHDVTLAGRRVAVVGTGASAIQFVPAIQPTVGHLTLFQRTPPWIVPRHDRAISSVERGAYAALPGAQQAVRAAIYATRELTFLPFRHAALRRLVTHLARRHLVSQVADPALRARLTPDYGIGCKRILVSDDYYPALTRPNVTVEPSAIVRVRPGAIDTANGASHPAEVIVLGTGFRPTDPPLAPYIVGREGQSLATAWRQTLTAYNSTTVAGFPNLFVIPGPNAGLGHTSMIYMIESQITHLVRAVQHLERTGAAALEPRPDAQAAYVAHVDAKMQATVWMQGGCASWYLDHSGRNSTLWPDFTWRFRRRVSQFHAADYVIAPRHAGAPSSHPVPS